MEIKWTEDDIVCGRIVCKPSTKQTFKADGWTAKWTYKIGWHVSKDADSHFATIAMTDGMISKGRTKAEMAEWLNQEKMIPMPHGWLIETMEFLRDCYEHQPA